MRKFILIAIILTFSFAYAEDNYPTANINLDVMIRNPHWQGTLATAHNGGILYGPQDTIIVFAKSCAAGADIIEVDVRITADGQLISFHDKEFDFFNSTGTGLVRERTLEYIRTIRTRSYFADVPPQPIPTFREALVFLKDKKVCLNVEPKDNVLEQIIREVAEVGMLNQVLIQAKSPNRAKEIRALNSKVGILARYRQESDIEEFAPYHPEVMEVNPEVTDEIIAKIKAIGAKVQIKTGYLKDLDFDEKDWQKRIDRGVNIALTDFVPEMVSFLRRTAFNVGSEARPRSGGMKKTGYTYLNTDAVAQKSGKLQFARIFMATPGKGKVKVFRSTADSFELVQETKLVTLTKGINIIGLSCVVSKGDFIGLYLAEGEVAAQRNTLLHKTMWCEGDMGNSAKNIWMMEDLGFSVDGFIK